MRTTGGAWPDANTRVKLAERIQVSQFDQHEYEFASLTGSVRVKCEWGQDASMPDVIGRLKTGTSANELSLMLSSAVPEIRLVSFLQELAARGLLAGAPVEGDGPTAAEQRQYAEQTRFFGNFPLHGQLPPAPGEMAGSTDGAWEVQRRLGHSHVLLAGLGRMGSKLACVLAQLGIGKIHAIDDRPVMPADVIDSGFHRMDIGQLRREVLPTLIRDANPLVEFIPHASEVPSADRPFVVPEGIQLVIVCQDEFDPDHYLAVNRACLARKTRWISIRNLGRRIEIGPLIVPFETACFRCLEIRKLTNLSYYQDYLATQRKLAEKQMTLGMPNVTLGCDFLALEVIKALTHFNHPVSFGSVLTINLLTMETQIHPVLKVPRCPDCSRAANDRPSTSIWNIDDVFKSL